MKFTPINYACVSVACLTFACQSMAVSFGTAFTYQGRLTVGANVANGYYDVKFGLFDGSNGGNQVGSIQTSINVTNGLISYALDFGGVYDGGARWLELAVRTNGNGGFTTLSPRQALTPAPYAVAASNLAGTLPAAQLTGTISANQLAGSYTGAVTFNNPANSFSGDGSGLVGVDAITLGGFGFCNLPCYWKLTGNAGTTPGLNFLGTTDDKALELKVNGLRALRLEPDSSCPNIIGGFLGNYIYSGTFGSTIAGGGTYFMTNTIDVFHDGSPVSDYIPLFGTISGGVSNQIYGNGYSSIAGGISNTITGRFSTGNNAISGGAGNTILHAHGSSIAGGEVNGIVSEFNTVSAYSTIGGGRSNLITEAGGNSSVDATIAGGEANHIEGAQFSTIAGGNGNRVFQGYLATIGGGHSNLIYVPGPGATIAGGVKNQIYYFSTTYGTIGGGSNNIIDIESARGSFAGTIAGGINNRIGSADTSFIGGGTGNSIVGHDDITGATISGGSSNKIYEGFIASIAGGFANEIYQNSFASIGGGAGNSVFAESHGALIAGGISNNIQSFSPYATISGGNSNFINASYATIPGGARAAARNYGQMSYASGMFASSGDAQTSEYVCRGTTVSAAQADLFLDGSAQRMVVPANSTWSFEALIAGRTSSGNSAAYRLIGAIKNNGGTTSLFGAITKTVIGEDVPAWDANVIADDPTDSLVVRVTGAAATSIRWVATIRTTEVTF